MSLYEAIVVIESGVCYVATRKMAGRSYRILSVDGRSVTYAVGTNGPRPVTVPVWEFRKMAQQQGFRMVEESDE